MSYEKDKLFCKSFRSILIWKHISLCFVVLKALCHVFVIQAIDLTKFTDAQMYFSLDIMTHRLVNQRFKIVAIFSFEFLKRNTTIKEKRL